MKKTLALLLVICMLACHGNQAALPTRKRQQKPHRNLQQPRHRKPPRLERPQNPMPTRSLPSFWLLAGLAQLPTIRNNRSKPTPMPLSRSTTWSTAA